MRQLTSGEIEILERNNCRCESWQEISVGEGFTAENIRSTCFAGHITIGSNCQIINVLRIENYDIGDNVRMENCGEIVTEVGTTFGIGEDISVLNEAGGLEVQLSEYLTSNLAYLAVFDGVDFERLIFREIDMLDKYGKIGSGSRIISCGKIKNVRIGEYADIEVVTSLENGTILSCKGQQTKIARGVCASTFVIAEGAEITDNSIVKHCYIGNCVKVGGGYYAENCLVFANSELFCGEGISVFAGPFTVSHHKSTLLIAESMSFFNAGSATNGSNHHYKLGPSHYSVLDRGVKTGSGAYLLHPTRVGAFTMVVGSHKTHCDTRKFPFSMLVEKEGQSWLMVGQNLKTIANYRDEQKWKSRDRRVVKRDKITPEVFNPMVVESMKEAIEEIDRISENEGDVVLYHGVRIKKLMLQRARKQYEQMIEMLGMKFDDKHFRDIGGAIVPEDVIEQFDMEVVHGKYATMKEVVKAFEKIFEEAQAMYVTENQGNKELYSEYLNALLADARKDFFEGETYKYWFEENPDIIGLQEYYNGLISKFDES